MKFLFIVQGEGRGHLTQAITLEEILRRNGHEVVEVLVGKSSSRRLPGFFNRNIHAPVKRFVSPNFLPTPANKRVSLMRSVAYNLVKLPVYINSIKGYAQFTENQIWSFDFSASTDIPVAKYENYTHFPAGFFFAPNN